MITAFLGRNYQKVPKRIDKQIYYLAYIIQCHPFHVESIRIRTQTNSAYAEQVNRQIKVSASKRHSIPAAIHIDVINLKSNTEHNKYPIPKEIDKDTLLSWICAIIKSTQAGDIRAVKLIHSTIESLHLSIIYPPIYHALIYGHGKLGNIDTMLQLYEILIDDHKKQSDCNKLPIISSEIISTILNCLALHRRSIEAIKIFDKYLCMNDCKPQVDAFCMIFRHCALTANLELSGNYFVKMYKDFNIEPNSLCFKYILETCSYCKPPKYEEAISMLHSMKTHWNIEPNISHFTAVIHTLATPYALIENPLSQDVAVKTENNNNFEIYKFKLLHGRLFDNIYNNNNNNNNSNNKLSDSDLQRCLDLFDKMTDEYNIIPNDKAFGILFYAMDKANNLEMALKYRQYWKHKFPHVRQQAYSFIKLLSICSNINSWNDAIDIYKNTALTGTSYSNGMNCYIYDNDYLLQFQAYHKVQPEISVFNQLLRCAKNDISRQIFKGILDSKQADKIILERIKYIESQMYHFRWTPNDMTWIFLLQSAAIVQSNDLCNRFLKRMFQFFMKPYQQKYSQSFMNWGDNDKFYQDVGIPNEFNAGGR
eukprot:470646_1